MCLPCALDPGEALVAPGISPCPFGPRRTGRQLERPPPSGHTGHASASDALGGDLAPPSGDA
eukprot:6562124-Prymnesium_polylepis.1